MIKSRVFMWLFILLSPVFLSGCRYIIGIPVLILGAVGYTAYQGGKKTVEVTSDVAKAGTDRVSKRQRQLTEVIFKNGEFRTTHPASIAQLWNAARISVVQMGFRSLDGDCDLLSGELTAQTRKKKRVTIRLNATQLNTTELSIRVGSRGDLKASEMIYDKMVQNLGTAGGMVSQQFFRIPLDQIDGTIAGL